MSIVRRPTLLASVAVILSAFNAQGAITSIANAASFVKDKSLTPGSIFTIQGSGLTSATVTLDSPLSPAKTLGGVTLTVGGVPSSLFYVSPTRITAQIDTGVVPGSQTLILTSPTGIFTTKVTVADLGVPGLFGLPALGVRDGAVLNAITFARGPFSVSTSAGPTFLAIYGTGLDLSVAPTVTIGGIPVPVVFFGFAAGSMGLQQINVQLVDKLAGAGRVEVLVTAGGRTTNPVEVVILPNPRDGQGDDQQRARELAGLASVPGTSLALVADENDDVVRVVDISKRAVIRTIALPEGAEPVAVAANATATLAVVAERDRDKIAIIDLRTYKVISEITVGSGPGSVDIAGSLAVVVNQDSDNVSIVNLVTRAVVATVPVGRGPRAVSIDQARNLAYVTNEVDSSIFVIDIAMARVISSIVLEMNSRPQSILVAQGQGIAIVTEPSSTQGRVILLGLNPPSILGTFQVNPDDTGGSSDLALFGNRAFFANQAGSSISIAPVPLGGALTTLKVDAGPRALVIDTKDNLLLIGSEGTGTITLVDLSTLQIVGRIKGILGQDEADDDDDDHATKHDNRDDRDSAGNMPSVSRVTPDKSKPGDKTTITITGKNLDGATDLIFVDLDSLPGKGKGRGNGDSGNHDHGPFGTREPGIVATNIRVNAAGTQLTATVTIDRSVSKGDFVVRVATPNGESSFVISSANSFKVD
jgi:uncharacterized protein (TIGR03437 family)